MATFLTDVVQTDANNVDTATQDFTVTAQVGAAAGVKLVVLFGSLAGTTTPTVTCTDSKGNTYTLVDMQFRSNFGQMSIFHCDVVTPIVSGDTFTVSINPLNKRHMVRVIAFSDVGAVDVFAGADGGTGSPNATLTTTASGDLIVSGVYHGNDSTATWPAGYDAVENLETTVGTNDRSLKSAYHIGAAPQTESPDPTLGTSRTWVQVAVAFLATSTANSPPTANAGPDQSVNAFDVVTLDGSSSGDSDGTVVAYAWRQISGPAVTLSSTTAAKPTFTAPGVDGGGSLVFGLTVTDNLSADSVEDTVTITVSSADLFFFDGTAWQAMPSYVLQSGVWA